jgi:hypothetical protein
MNFAISKLRGVRRSKAPSGSNDDDEIAMAALGTRILFDFDPSRRSAVDLATKLVEGHMRLAYTIPKHREYMRTGASSEPILGAAAAIIMNDGQRSPDNWANILANHFESGIISEGQGAEVAMQLLLITAMDKAHQTMGTKEYNSPVPVEDFFIAFHGSTHAEKHIFKSRPRGAGENHPTFLEAFKEGRIRFTCFVRVYDSTVITDDFMWVCLLRGQAIQCWKNQKLVDYIIPILLYDKVLGRYVVTAMFIQVKDTDVAKHPYIDIKAFHIPFFSDPELDSKPMTAEDKERANSRPYIAMTANLGVQKPRSSISAYVASHGKNEIRGESKQGDTGKKSKKGKKARKPSANVVPGARQRTPPGSFTHNPISPSKVEAQGQTEDRPNLRSPPPAHPCYAYEVTGCSHEVYAVIGPEGKHIWRRLLGVPDLLNEHPRPTRGAIGAVLNMKPFWSANLHSMEFVGQPTKRPDRLGDRYERDEKMYTGTADANEEDSEDAEEEIEGEEMDVDEEAYDDDDDDEDAIRGFPNLPSNLTIIS